MSSSQKTAVLSKGLLETQLASFYLLSQYFEANSRPMGILRTKGPNDLQGLNPAVSGAHPADVWIFFLTSLPSSHRAVLRSPRLNELTSMDGWEEEESVRRSGFFPTKDSIYG